MIGKEELIDQLSLILCLRCMDLEEDRGFCIELREMMKGILKNRGGKEGKRLEQRAPRS